VVATVAVATFLSALHNGLLGDDVLLLEERLHEEHAASLRQLLLDSYWGDLHRSGLYRPLSLTFLAIQRSAFGLDPAPYHGVNLVLHALCAMLVFRLLARVLPAAGAFAGALVFAAHPIHAEAVGTIYGQQDLLAALFFLAATAAGGTRAYSALGPRTLVVGSFYLLSLLSKEQGILLPLLLPLLRRSARNPAPRLSASDLAMAVPLGLYLLLRFQVLGGEAVPTGEASVARGYPSWARVNLAIVTVGTYLRLLVLPWGQTTYYGHLRDSLFGFPMVELLAVFGAVLLFASLQLRVGRPVVQLACAFLAITLLPVANVVPIGVVVAERCLYLPVFAVCLLAGAGYAKAAPETPRAAAAALCGAVLLGVLLSTRVAVRWSTPLAHWETTVRDHPRSATAHARLALLLLQEASRAPGEWDAAALARAEAATERALSINDRLPEAWQASGSLALVRGDCPAAVAAFERALALRPEDRQIVRLLSRCR
jgi:hypothetical protein